MTGLKVSQKRRSLRRVVKLAAPISSAPDIVKLQRIDTVAIIVCDHHVQAIVRRNMAFAGKFMAASLAVRANPIGKVRIIVLMVPVVMLGCILAVAIAMPSIMPIGVPLAMAIAKIIRIAMSVSAMIMVIMPVVVVITLIVPNDHTGANRK